LILPGFNPTEGIPIQVKKYRAGTRRALIVEMIEAGKSRLEAFYALRPMTDAQIEPMVFKANVRGYGRQPKPMAEQIIELRNDINRVYAEQGKADDGSLPKDDSPAPTPAIPTPEIQEEEMPEEETPEEVKPIRAKGKMTLRDEMLKWRKRVREVRKFCADRARLSEEIDDLATRPSEAAARLIPKGVPTEALLDAMTMHWAEDTRHDAGIDKFDFMRLSAEVIAERKIDEIEGKPVHEMFGYALLLAEARQPLMLIGPAGTGKSFLAYQLSRYLGLDYGETPISSGATRGDLLGRLVGPDNFIVSQFIENYSGGGVFNFEEIDAADPSTLIVLNNALANGRLFNSSNGVRYDQSPDFVPVATANTFGIGANRTYTAREKLDGATIDRWRMGRIFLPFSEYIEDKILGLASE
jgi:AAA domain (dynein-related subfamily)